jgi:hypothetical protein
MSKVIRFVATLGCATLQGLKYTFDFLWNNIPQEKTHQKMIY